MSKRQQNDLHKVVDAEIQADEEFLNGTLANGVHLFSKHLDDGVAEIVYTPNRVGGNSDLIPLALGQEKAKLGLKYWRKFAFDDNGYVEEIQSTYEVWELEPEKELLSYHVEPEEGGKYPRAHFHIHGYLEAAQVLFEIAGRHKGVTGKFHLPVGGRGPGLVGVAEFLIIAECVQARTGWQDQVEKARKRGHDGQTRTMVRESIEIVVAELLSYGWQVIPPVRLTENKGVGDD